MNYRQKQIKLGNISTSERELKDILKAWAAISFAFAVVLGGSIFAPGFYATFIISSLTVGIGFLLHEMGHKIVAQRYGCFAEFRSFDKMLLLAVAMSFFGFVFAAPGAVMIAGRISRERNGRISAAGPVVNLILALVFLAASFLPAANLFKMTAYYGFMINSWLALFNMIPFWMFDGYKVLKWSKLAYGVIVAVAALFLFAKGFLALPG